MNDALTQFGMVLRKSQRKQLTLLAASADMTMRAFVLNALRAQGLNVSDEDIADLRGARRERREEQSAIEPVAAE